MDLMQRGMAWFATKMQQFASRTITYKGVRDGELATATIVVGLGSSQVAPISQLGISQSATDFAESNAIEVDRDYIIKASDLGDMWPPTTGDYVDDPNDEDGVIKRYALKTLQGQTPWHWIKGSYNILARVHFKYVQDVVNYWSDTFTGSGAITSHTADSGGTYSGGAGTVTISGDKIVASEATSYAYFAPGEVITVTRANFSLNTTAGALNGKFAELGIGVRCAIGSGLQDGYYCTIKVGYTGTTQTTKQLRIVRHRLGANTTLDTLDLPSALSLTDTYMLIVANSEERVVVTLADSTGAVAITSLGAESSLLNDLTGQAVYFAHTLTDPTAPWMDTLTVEAS